MELKINISEDTYEEIKKDDKILLSKVHELFDAVRNGTPTDEVDEKIPTLPGMEPFQTFILDKKEADIFNSLSNEQKEVVCKLLDNAVEEAQKEKDKSDVLMPTEKEIDDYVEVCRLMTVYLGRKFMPHEGNFMALYKTRAKQRDVYRIERYKDRILVKLLIRSLVPTEE